MLGNRVLSESVCRLFPLVLSDLIDEDIARHSRVCMPLPLRVCRPCRPLPSTTTSHTLPNLQSKTLSASLVGTAAFVSKFGQSLAPMLAYSVLPPSSSSGGDGGGGGGSGGGGGLGDAAVGHREREATPGVQDRIWGLLLAIPTLTAATQLVLWTTTYRLRGAYLQQIKASVATLHGRHDCAGDSPPCPPSSPPPHPSAASSIVGGGGSSSANSGVALPVPV